MRSCATPRVSDTKKNAAMNCSSIILRECECCGFRMRADHRKGAGDRRFRNPMCRAAGGVTAHARRTGKSRSNTPNHRAFGSAAKKITAVGEQNPGHEIECWNNPTNAPRRCAGAICVRYGRASIEDPPMATPAKNRYATNEELPRKSAA
jgi:hypothetical protein